MTPPSDNTGDDDNERTRIGVPLPPRRDAERSEDETSQPPERSAPPVQQPPVSQPPAGGHGLQQPPYSQPPQQDDQASGWTMFGQPLTDPSRDPAPQQPPASAPPPAEPDYGFGDPDPVPPAPGHVPGPGEPGWIPGGGYDTEEPAPSTGGAPGPGEPGWVPGGGEPAPAQTGGVPGPGEPGWVPGGAEPPAADPVPGATGGGAPGPGEPGWVPGGAKPPAADPVPGVPSGAAPGPGEPGWVPGGAEPPSAASRPPAPGEPGWTPGATDPVYDPAAQASVPPQQPPVSQPPVSQAPVSQAPVSQPPVSQAPISQPPVSQPPEGYGEPAAPPPDPQTYQPTRAVSPEDVPTATGAPEAAATAAATAAVAAPQPRRPRRSDGPTLEIGTVINNNYRIDEVLKAGGMGEVYRGAEVGTGDPVAIKVILPELAEDEKVGQMFKREARTLRQLQDEAIVRYYNYVHDPDLDAYCLVMSFIAGVPLSDHTQANGPISIEDGKILLRRLAKGLEKAHELDVIHRDLSPDNVMLPEGVVSKAVLIDFGIAKSNVEKEQTLAGQFAGKFRYVSPEQLGHYGGEIGPQSDIYSLALLMAAALIGTPLDMGSSIVQAVESRRTVPDISAVGPDLRPILMHMLEPDPANRPQTMGDIIRLMDYPEQIPLNYRQGLPLPNTALTHSGTTGVTTGLPYRPPTNQVSGLQLAPTTATAGGTATPTDLPKRRGGGGGLGLALILALALMGGGGYYGYSQGWFDPPPAPEPDAPELGEAPTRLTDTREGFLAEFNSGGCTYATVVDGGDNAGAIAAMAPRADAFDGLEATYAQAFGETPEILNRQVTESQCAALSLARSLQGTNMEPVQVALSSENAASGMTVRGTLTDPDARPVWLVLITPNGQIYNLTSRLSDPVGAERSFEFNLNPLAEGAEPQPNLLLAVVTEEPLVRAAAARDRTPASDLMPLIEREIESRNGRGVADLGHVLLEPYVDATPAPEPEPAPAEETGTEGDAPPADPDDPAVLLTTEGFEADAIRDLIAGSDLSDLQKTALTAAVNAAESNSALLEPTLAQIRAALGLE